MNQAKQMIRCGAEYDLGVTGRGVGVAVLDTGIFLHEDFEDRVVVFRDMLQRRNEPYDDNGHGTHISAIIGGAGIASEGRYCGVAPGCNLISIKVLDKKGNGYASDVLAGIRWIRENKDRYGIRIVNISVGSYSRKNMNENSALVKGVNAAWDDGLVVVVAAGNQGPGRMTITTPGISRKVITVGCSDDHKEVNVMGNRMVDYSGRGPTGACICKPDVVAPGSSIISCANAPGRYMIKSGTSMSTPLVSGAIALLLEKYPDMSNRDVKLRLRERCVDLGLPRNQQGWGGLDVCRLLE
ncbi:MAG: S8 family peptidase [Hungatella hathewayi]|nr:S8 family peptidase [Hungatella hathewayi]MBS4983889.1 S8 family peptidase [Hungatella hathewayi]